MNVEKQFYLTVGLCGVVLNDVKGLMKESFPWLLPIRATSIGDAVAQVSIAQSVPFAFLNLPPGAVATGPLSHELTTRKTKIVLLGDDAEEAESGSPFAVLMRPFSGEDILRILGVAPVTDPAGDCRPPANRT